MKFNDNFVACLAQFITQYIFYIVMEWIEVVGQQSKTKSSIKKI